MARPGSTPPREGGLFGAPLDGDGSGTRQRSIDADIVVLPGGLVLVEQSSPLAALPAFGATVTGDIHCNNGRD